MFCHIPLHSVLYSKFHFELHNPICIIEITGLQKVYKTPFVLALEKTLKLISNRIANNRIRRDCASFDLFGDSVVFHTSTHKSGQLGVSLWEKDIWHAAANGLNKCKDMEMRPGVNENGSLSLSLALSHL